MTRQRKQQQELHPEPETPWSQSLARLLLEKDIKNGDVPLTAKDKDGKKTVPILEDIYKMRPEYADYWYSKFSGRLSSLRASIRSANSKKGEPREPAIKWKKSKAKKLLYSDLMEGVLDLEPEEEETQEILEGIYAMHPEYAEYKFSRFASRLKTLRKTILTCNARAEEDKKHFLAFFKNNPASECSHKGYIEWAGSAAQEYMREDLEEKLHIKIGKKELFGSRPEYYENFTLEVFRQKMYQEIRTAKYLHTCEVRGKFAVAS